MTALRLEDTRSLAADKPFSLLYPEFRKNAEAIGAKVYHCPTAKEVKEQIFKIIDNLNAQKIVIAPSPLVDRLALGEIEREGLNVYSNNLLKNGAAADLGISEVDYAIVETGSLCQDALDVNKRLVSSLPPVHIALVPSEHIMLEFAESLNPLKESGALAKTGYYSYISGPSRTSDIERVLTIGVHGPEELHIIFV